MEVESIASSVSPTVTAGAKNTHWMIVPIGAIGMSNILGKFHIW